MRIQLHYHLLSNNLDVWESRQHYCCFIFSVVFFCRHISGSKRVRETKIKTMLSFDFSPPVLFNCLCNLKHHSPFKDYGLQDWQAGWSHCVADSKQSHSHSDQWLSPSPLPLLQRLLRAGGGSRVHILFILFVWGHHLPTFNTFPLHSSVLKPYFDLGDKKKIITRCLNLRCISRVMHICVYQQTDDLWNSRRKGEQSLTSLTNPSL